VGPLNCWQQKPKIANVPVHEGVVLLELLRAMVVQFFHSEIWPSEVLLQKVSGCSVYTKRACKTAHATAQQVNHEVD
jgi:hypothetical protein